jgi:hypothetical protein
MVQEPSFFFLSLFFLPFCITLLQSLLWVFELRRSFGYHISLPYLGYHT